MRKGKIREIRTKSNKKKQDDDDAKSQLYYEEHEYSEAGYNFTMMKNINCSKIQILDEDNNIISFSADKTFYFYNLIDKKVSHSSVNKIWNVQKQTTQKLSRQQQCCIFNKEYFIFINSKNQIFVWKYTEEDAFIEMLCETPYETQFTGIQFVTPDRILIVNDKVIEQWDLESFELMNYKQFSGDVNSSISKFKNNYLITNGFNLMRFSIDEDELKFRDSFRSRNKLSNYKYNEDGNFIYITFNSNCLYMLYSKTKKQIRKFKMTKVQLIVQIEAYKDQIIILNSVKCRIQFIHIYDGSETLRLKIDESQDPSFALSSDQSLLISNDCHGIKGWYLNQLV